MKHHRHAPGTARDARSAGRGLSALLLSIVFLLTAAAAFAAVARAGTDPDAPPPSISSDKADYAPGELVTLHGSNWAPGESVTVVVNDNAGETWRRDVDVVADESGTISDQFNLPDWFVAVYTVTATGASSGTATTTFTDGNVQVRTSGPSVTFTWKLYTGNATCSGSHQTSGSQTTGTSSVLLTGVDAGQSLSISVPSTAGGQNFDGWTAQGGFSSSSNPLCWAGLSGNRTLTAEYVAPSDTTAPTTTATPAPAANAAGWHKSNVSVSLGATDNTGGSGVQEITYSASGAETIASTTVSASSVSGISITAEGTTTLNFFAKDNAGNSEATKTLVVRLDKTAPTITQFDFSPAANLAGWHTSDITVRFKATDALSGLDAACQTAFPLVSGDRLQSKVISTEGNPVTVDSNSCSDVAGNTGAAKRSDDFKLDMTAPVDVATTLDRGPDNNGWYNHAVGWTTSGTDATSGIDACSSGTYNGPDGSSNTVSGHCTDVAGNSSADADSAAFDYDATAPTDVATTLDRGPDNNGWYNHAVGWTTSGTDATSGIDACSSGTYNGPDGSSNTVSGHCTDVAGNSSADADSAAFDYDATAPSASATPSRAPDHNGWYNHAFSVSYSGTDATSGIDSCSATDNYSGPDTASDSLTGSCTDNAGNSDSASYGFKYDATAPSASATPSRAPDHNGWYNHAFSVSYSGTDATSGIDSCSATDNYSGPDTASDSLTGSCTDNAGNSDSASYGFKYDATAPTGVATTLDRGPDNNGWYNHAVGWTTSGTDATSGIDACSSGTYDGPDGSGKKVSGHCTDNAGNSSADADSAAFDYDATAPTLNPSVSPNPVVLNGSATASPNASDNLSGVDSSSCGPVDTSSVGAKSVACAATDEAGNTNAASASYSVVYDWSGFFRPVDNLPGLNKAKAGSAIPVKFSLAGNQGMAIFMNGYPTSAPVVCGSTASADLVEETVTAGQSSLNYDAAAGQYVYVWKTNTGWANTCRTLTLKLVDGTVHQANFWFVK